MATFGQMVADIRTDLNRGSSADDRIKKAIEDAIKFYRARRFGWNMKRATTTTTAGVEYFALPADFLEVDSLRIRDGDYTTLLTETNFLELDELSTTTQQSKPSKYAVQNRELRMYPIPDTAYTITMSFLYDVGGVSASASDGATNAWTNEGEQLIRLHAQADLLKNYIGGQEAVADAAVKEMAELGVYNELKRRANREQSTGRTRPSL